MEDWVTRTLQPKRLLTSMVAFFGSASLMLACLGLYGVVSYATALRRREFSVRMALGAPAAHVRLLVLRQAGGLALLGCAIGFALTWPVGRSVQSLLFGVSTADVVALSGSAAVLLAVCLIAASIPARQAARTDPALALRSE
jgi:ABC-type antimicrobial peptide transport system permease subunit